MLGNHARIFAVLFLALTLCAPSVYSHALKNSEEKSQIFETSKISIDLTGQSKNENLYLLIKREKEKRDLERIAGLAHLIGGIFLEKNPLERTQKTRKFAVLMTEEFRDGLGSSEAEKFREICTDIFEPFLIREAASLGSGISYPDWVEEEMKGPFSLFFTEESGGIPDAPEDAALALAEHARECLLSGAKNEYKETISWMVYILALIVKPEGSYSKEQLKAIRYKKLSEEEKSRTKMPYNYLVEYAAKTAGLTPAGGSLYFSDVREQSKGMVLGALEQLRSLFDPEAFSSLLTKDFWEKFDDEDSFTVFAAYQLMRRILREAEREAVSANLVVPYPRSIDLLISKLKKKKIGITKFGRPADKTGGKAGLSFPTDKNIFAVQTVRIFEEKIGLRMGYFLYGAPENLMEERVKDLGSDSISALLDLMNDEKIKTSPAITLRSQGDRILAEEIVEILERATEKRELIRRDRKLRNTYHDWARNVHLYSLQKAKGQDPAWQSIRECAEALVSETRPPVLNVFEIRNLLKRLLDDARTYSDRMMPYSVDELLDLEWLAKNRLPESDGELRRKALAALELERFKIMDEIRMVASLVREGRISKFDAGTVGEKMDASFFEKYLDKRKHFGDYVTRLRRNRLRQVVPQVEGLDKNSLLYEFPLKRLAILLAWAREFAFAGSVNDSNASSLGGKLMRHGAVRLPPEKTSILRKLKRVCHLIYHKLRTFVAERTSVISSDLPRTANRNEILGILKAFVRKQNIQRNRFVAA